MFNTCLLCNIYSIICWYKTIYRILYRNWYWLNITLIPLLINKELDQVVHHRGLNYLIHWIGKYFVSFVLPVKKVQVIISWLGSSCATWNNYLTSAWEFTVQILVVENIKIIITERKFMLINYISKFVLQMFHLVCN